MSWKDRDEADPYAHPVSKYWKSEIAGNECLESCIGKVLKRSETESSKEGVRNKRNIDQGFCVFRRGKKVKLSLSIIIPNFIQIESNTL